MNSLVSENDYLRIAPAYFIIMIIAVVIATVPIIANAASYYVDAGVIDDNGDGSESGPKKYISS